MVAGLEARGGVAAHEQRADRQTVGERLRERERVRLHFVELRGEQAPEAAHADLHFIEDQQRAALRAEVAGGGQKFRRRGQHAAFTLHRLDDERGGTVVDRRRKRVDVVERRECEAFRQRREAFFVGRRVGGGECAHRAAVERIVAGENRGALFFALAPSEFARELDRGFVCFGAGIAEEDRIKTREFGQTVGQDAGRFVVIEIAAVHERRRLIGDGTGDARMRVTERDHRKAGHHVDVAVPRFIEEIHALAAHDVDLLARVVRHQMRMPRHDACAALDSRNRTHVKSFL